MQQVQNGLYAARKMNNQVHSIFIDEETLELQALSEATRKNREREQRKLAAQQAAAAEQQRKAQKEENRRRRAARNILSQELKLLGMALAVFAGQQMGLVDWAWAAPVLGGIQALIFYRAGRYFGKTTRT